MDAKESFTVSDPSLVFAATPEPPAGLEIRINFGVFAGREVTAAEIDDLAARLLPEVGEVTIVAEQRHELSDHFEASIHQVRVEIDASRLPDDEDELATVRERLLGASDMWARGAIHARHVEV